MTNKDEDIYAILGQQPPSEKHDYLLVKHRNKNLEEKNKKLRLKIEKHKHKIREKQKIIAKLKELRTAYTLKRNFHQEQLKQSQRPSQRPTRCGR